MTLPDGNIVRRYQANDPSPAAPLGFGDEALVRQVLDVSQEIPADANPSVQVFSAGDPAWPMLGPVVVQGELKTLLGGVPGEASCPWTSLHHVDDAGFSRTFVAPMAGLVHFHLTCGGTGTHQIRANGSASAARNA